MPEQLRPEIKRKDRRKSALLKVFGWLFLDRERAKISEDDEELKRRISKHIERLEPKSKPSKEKADTGKEILEIQETKKRFRYRERLQHAIGETRTLIANMKGAEELKPEILFDIKEDLIDKHELTKRRSFPKSLEKHLIEKIAEESKTNPEEISEETKVKVNSEIRRAEMAAMYKNIISGNVHFGIRGEIELGASGSEAKKVFINLDAEESEQKIKDMKDARISEIEEAYKNKEKMTDEEEKKEQEQLKKLKEGVEKEFGILEKVRKLRQINQSEKGYSSTEIEVNQAEVDELVKETEEVITENQMIVGNSDEKSHLAYTNIESVIDSDTLDGKQKRDVNKETIKELKKSNAEGIKNLIKEEPEEVYKKVKTQERPAHTQLLENTIDNFAKKHNEARKFFDDGTGKHLSEKLLEEVAEERDDEAVKTSEKLKEKEEDLKKIVNESLNESYQLTENERLNQQDKLIHVPGGVAIVVNDADRFTKLTHMSSDEETRNRFANTIKEKGVSGAYLKGEIAEEIKKGGYSGDVIIVYSEDDQLQTIENNWDQILEGRDIKKTLVHEIDHLLQKRQLEGFAEGTNELLEKLRRNGTETSVENIYSSLFENGDKSPYFIDVKTDPLLKAIADKIVTPEQALEAYYDSMGIDPSETQNLGSEILKKISTRRTTREALFEYSSILADGDTTFGEPNLGFLYMETPDKDIPEEHLEIYRFFKAANKAIENARNAASPEEVATLRREIVGIIQTGYHKDTKTLVERLYQFIPEKYLSTEEKDQIDSFVKENDQNKEAIYGKDSLIPKNSDIDFSVFPVKNRFPKDYSGGSNVNEAIDFVDAWSTTIFGAPFSAIRSATLESQARGFEKEGNHEMARYMRLRKPENRAGEEINPDSTLPMKIVENLPIIGGFMLPGKIEWAKAGLLYPKGHPLYGRTMKRIPVVGQIVERHFPVLLEKGPFKTIKGYEPIPDKLVSADKNIESILSGIQVGLDSMGLDQQEMMAVIEALPLFKTVQSSPGLEPRVVYSQSALQEEPKQIWADRRSWSINFKNEVIYGENLKSGNGDNDIKEQIRETEEAIRKEPNKLGKKMVSLNKKLNGLKNLLKKDVGEVSVLKDIYERMAAQKGREKDKQFTMRHLVEFARKSHEGKFWNLDPNKPRPHYFKVSIPDGNGETKDFDLTDINLFIKRYTRAYVKEIFQSEVNPDSRQKIAVKNYNARNAEYQLPLARANLAKEMRDGIDANGQIIPGHEEGIMSAQRDLKQVEDAIEAGSQDYNFLKEKDFGYKPGTFFDIAWGEAESMLDNHKMGMEFYADYQFRVVQAGLVERKTSVAATFYNRLDRILDNFGHTAIIAGLGLAFATGAPVGITLVLAGAGLLLADAAFVTKAQQIWQMRRRQALEAQEKLDNMISLYQQAASGKMLDPDTLEMLGRQKERLTFMVESIMKVDPKEVVKFPANKPLFAIIGTGLALFDEYGANILAGKI